MQINLFAVVRRLHLAVDWGFVYTTGEFKNGGFTLKLLKCVPSALRRRNLKAKQ